jgi:hypothetical protein
MTAGIDPEPRDLGRGAWVGWSADRTGYSVTVYDPDSIEVYRYDAGNSPHDSGAYVPLDSKSPRVPLGTLRKFAKQTSQEIAREWGINLEMIHDETDESGD